MAENLSDATDVVDAEVAGVKVVQSAGVPAVIDRTVLRALFAGVTTANPGSGVRHVDSNAGKKADFLSDPWDDITQETLKLGGIE
jgi:hypothetical protein